MGKAYLARNDLIRTAVEDNAQLSVGKETFVGGNVGAVGGAVRDRILALRAAGQAASKEGVSLLVRLLARPDDVFLVEAYLATGTMRGDAELAARYAPVIEAAADDIKQAYDAAIRLRGGGGLAAVLEKAKAKTKKQAPTPTPSQTSMSALPKALVRDAEATDEPPKPATATSVNATIFKGLVGFVELNLEAGWLSGDMKKNRDWEVKGPSLTAEAKTTLEAGAWKPKITTNVNLLKSGVVCQINGHDIAFGFDLKLLEAGTEKIDPKSVLDGSVGKLRALKVSGSAMVPFPDDNGAMLVRIKADASIAVEQLLDPKEIAKLQKLLGNVDELARTIESTGKYIDEADDLYRATRGAGKQIASRITTKSGQRVRNAVMKQLAKLRGQRTAINALRRSLGPVGKKIVGSVLKKQMSRVVAKLAVKALGFAFRWIPVIGWALAVWDIVQLAYFGWRWWRGDLRFDPGGDGEEASIFDGFGDLPKGNSDQPGDGQGDGDGSAQRPQQAQQPPQGDGQKPPQLQQLPKEKREQLEKASGPKARLFDAVLQKLPTRTLEPRHLIRLLDLTDNANLTGAEVDQIIAQLGGVGDPDKALDALAKLIQQLVAKRTTTGGGGGDDDGQGDGDGKQKQKQRQKGDGEGDGKTSRNTGGGAGDGDRSVVSKVLQIVPDGSEPLESSEPTTMSFKKTKSGNYQLYWNVDKYRRVRIPGTSKVTRDRAGKITRIVFVVAPGYAGTPMIKDKQGREVGEIELPARYVWQPGWSDWKKEN